MSWSEGRSKSSNQPSPEVMKEKLRQVDSVLQMFARDVDLQDDLKMKEVKRAIKHWTGEERLPIEEAMALQDHRRVVYVLQRLQILQQVCRDAGIKVPLDLMLKGANQLPESFVTSVLGGGGSDKNSGVTSASPPTTSSTSSSAAAAPPTKQASTSQQPKKNIEQAVPKEASKESSISTKANDIDAKDDKGVPSTSSMVEHEKEKQAAGTVSNNSILSQMLVSLVVALIAAGITWMMIKK